MALTSVGIQTHIWNNNFWSLVFVGLYPFIMLGLLWLGGAAVGYVTAPYNVDRALFAQQFGTQIFFDYWPLLLSVVGIWFLISFAFHTRMISKLAHAHSVTRKDEPELYNMVENLAIASGVPTPKINIIESHARNAFASGINHKTYTITVTRGQLNSLEKDEVEAVLAHEMTHIINQDVRLLMVCIVFTGMVGLAAQLMWSNLRYSLYLPRRNKKGGSAGLIILAIALVLWVGYFATLFTRFAVSRKREYMADAGAIELTKNPDAMMRALLRISGMDKMRTTSADIQMMCIENSVPFLGLFSTHPPIQRRVEAISKTTGTPVPQLSYNKPETSDIPFLRNDRNNPWLSRERPFRKSNNPWIK